MRSGKFAVSQRILGVQPPIIPIVADLIRAHPGTISLGQGVVYSSDRVDITDDILNKLTSSQ